MMLIILIFLNNCCYNKINLNKFKVNKFKVEQNSLDDFSNKNVIEDNTHISFNANEEIIIEQNTNLLDLTLTQNKESIFLEESNISINQDLIKKLEIQEDIELLPLGKKVLNFVNDMDLNSIHNSFLNKFFDQPLKISEILYISFESYKKHILNNKLRFNFLDEENIIKEIKSAKELSRKESKSLNEGGAIKRLLEEYNLEDIPYLMKKVVSAEDLEFHCVENDIYFKVDSLHYTLHAFERCMERKLRSIDIKEFILDFVNKLEKEFLKQNEYIKNIYSPLSTRNNLLENISNFYLYAPYEIKDVTFYQNKNKQTENEIIIYDENKKIRIVLSITHNLIITAVRRFKIRDKRLNNRFVLENSINEEIINEI